MTTVRVRVSCACASIVCAAGLLASASTLIRASQDQQPRPPFRTTTSLVRVDAYPTRDGRIIPNLTAADFEVLEDGVPQKIESFEYVEFPQNNPLDGRRDPNSQRDAFQLAADPNYRVFVVYLDNLHVDVAHSHQIRVPLITFLNRLLGPKDLFGVLTTRQGPADLILGQQTEFIEEQLTKYWAWGQKGTVLDDEEDLMLQACYPQTFGPLVHRRRLDEVFSDLEGLVATLGSIREERTNVMLVTNGWVIPGPASGFRDAAQARPRPPSVGVTNAGKLTLGRRGTPNEVDTRWCEEQLERLTITDFRQRFRDLLQFARRSNVSFYSLRPAGLVAPGDFFISGGQDREMTDALLTLSNNTDGVAVVNTNDLTAGARRITDDLSAVYLLGYYPTNQKADGRIRKITVRLKGRGESVRARREYRAPTAEEVAELGRATEARATEPPKPSEEAFAALRSLRPGAALHTRGTIVGSALIVTTELTGPQVEAGKWKSGGDVQVMVTGTGGDILATGRGRIDAGQRAAVIRLGVAEKDGPFHVAVRLRNDSDGEVQDGLSVSRSTSALGDPLLFRLATPSLMRPAGSIVFRRTERMRVQWPLTSALEEVTARVLGRDGTPLELSASPTLEEQDDVRFAVVVLNLAPLTAGEYLLEIGGTVGSERATARLAFRVTR